MRSRAESLREELIRRHTALVDELHLHYANLGAVLVQVRRIPRPRGSNTVLSDLQSNIGKVVPLPAPSNRLVLPLGRVDFDLYLRIDDAAAACGNEPGALDDRVKDEYGYGAAEARRRYDSIVQALADHAGADPPLEIFLLPVDGEPLPPYTDPQLSDAHGGRFEKRRPPLGHWVKMARLHANKLGVSVEALGPLQGRRSPRHQALKEARATIALHLADRGALNVEIARVLRLTPSAVSRLLADADEQRARELKRAAEEEANAVTDDIRRELQQDEGGTDG